MDFAKKKKKSAKKESRITALVIKLGVICVVCITLVIYIITRSAPGRTNIVVISKNPFLISLNNDEKSATIVSIPQNTMVTSTYGKGNVLAGSLYKLDSLSNKRGQIIDTTVREFLGLPVDGWIYIGDDFEVADGNDFLNVMQSSLGLTNGLIPGQKTNLSFLEKPRFYYALNQVRPDRISVIDLQKSGTLHEAVLPDGSSNLEPDLVQIDSFLNSDFDELEMLKEGLSIAVLNGSEAPGLATRASRIISNAGGNVIQVGESPLRVVDCILYASEKEKNLYTVKRIKNMFDCDISTDTIEESRADIAIVVGDDYYQQVTGSSK